jgi:hypothetical protein
MRVERRTPFSGSADWFPSPFTLIPSLEGRLMDGPRPPLDAEARKFPTPILSSGPIELFKDEVGVACTLPDLQP